MKGKLKCTACGHTFDVKEASITFDLGTKSPSGEFTCPKCQSGAVEPAFEEP